MLGWWGSMVATEVHDQEEGLWIPPHPLLLGWRNPLSCPYLEALEPSPRRTPTHCHCLQPQKRMAGQGSAAGGIEVGLLSMKEKLVAYSLVGWPGGGA